MKLRYPHLPCLQVSRGGIDLSTFDLTLNGFLGRAGTQAHLLTIGGLQHRRWPTVYQEVNGHADVYYD